MSARPDWCSTLNWRKSRTSESINQCVEIARFGEDVLITDSYSRFDVLRFTHDEWWRLVTRIRCGDLDRG
jgi:hypothetical protein